MITPTPAEAAHPDWAKMTANCIANIPNMPAFHQDVFLSEDARPWPDAAAQDSIATRVRVRAIADAIRARRAAHPEWADKP